MEGTEACKKLNKEMAEIDKYIEYLGDEIDSETEDEEEEIY